MSVHTQESVKRITVPDIAGRKGGEPIVCLTAYDAPMAALLDPHCDVLLVGDSLGMAVHGLPNTVGVTLEMMILHGQAVMRGARRAMVVVDMPFGSYEGGKEVASANCVRVMKETGAQAVKLETSIEMAEIVAFLVKRGIPVMGHVGLRPQAILAEGGFKAPERPILFAKTPNTLNGPFDPIVLPRSSGQVDWEVELAVIIGLSALEVIHGEFSIGVFVAYNAMAYILLSPFNQIISAIAQIGNAAGSFECVNDLLQVATSDPLSANAQVPAVWNIVAKDLSFSYGGQPVLRELCFDIAAGSYEFKLASGDWSTVDFGAGADGQSVTLGQAKTLNRGGANLQVTIAICFIFPLLV